ncbi:D-aminoacyl-tRNA deacylase [soil metagenome]
MRVLIQRVTKASVTTEGKIKSSIGKGLLVLVGVEEADMQEDLQWLSQKIVNLRIFDDAQGVMNLSVKEIAGEILIISQFTLHAATKKGNRPSYIKAAKPDVAIPLYESFVKQIEIDLDKKVGTGEFGADMQVELINDGPVTIWMDSKERDY